jgi:hypothetical protein
MQVNGSGIRGLTQLGLVIGIMAALVATSDPAPRSESLASPARPKPHAPSPLGEEAAAARRIEVLLAGIPQRGRALGDPDAPVTLRFFADLECPEARQFVLGAMPFLVRRWIRHGKLRIVYRGFPAETVWSGVFRHQQTAALAAGRQDKLWQYVDFFYHRQGPEYTRYAIAHFLVTMAEDVRGLDLERWRADWRRRDLAHGVKSDVRLGTEYGLRPLRPFTPAFFVGPTGSRGKPLLHFSLTESAAFDEAIEGVLRRGA